MKIVHLCLGCFYVDNYSYQENMLPKYHVKMGHDVTVIASLLSFDKNGKPCYLEKASEYHDKNGYKVVRLNYKLPRGIFKILKGYQGLYDRLEIEQPDVIFIHGVAIYDTSVVVKYLKSHPRVKLYGDNHGDYINSAKTWLSKNILNGIIRRYYVSRLDPYLIKCFGVTPLRCEFLKDVYGVDPRKVEFLPMGVDDEAIPQDRNAIRSQIRQELNISEDSFVIITGGKIDTKKNIHILIESLKAINNKSIHLIICGVLAPEMQYLKTMFDENIHYLGWCSAEKVMNCMISSDMACFPGTHSTLWEQAVGVGLPVIFKYWDGMTHMNVCDNCLFINGEDTQEIVSRIKYITSSDNYINVKSKALQASKEFLYSNIAKKAIGEDC